MILEKRVVIMIREGKKGALTSSARKCSAKFTQILWRQG
jgi:hypothetical protein